jgi:hypothetical protein
MKKAYLRVKKIPCSGIFSNERLIEVAASDGKVYEGIFQEGHMKGDSLVNILGYLESDDLCLIKVMHGEGCGFYGNGIDGYPYLTVNKEQIFFEDDKR